MEAIIMSLLADGGWAIALVVILSVGLWRALGTVNNLVKASLTTNERLAKAIEKQSEMNDRFAGVLNEQTDIMSKLSDNIDRLHSKLDRKRGIFL